jgi:hypothetical protein
MRTRTTVRAHGVDADPLRAPVDADTTAKSAVVVLEPTANCNESCSGTVWITVEDEVRHGHISAQLSVFLKLRLVLSTPLVATAVAMYSRSRLRLVVFYVCVGCTCGGRGGRS